MPAYSKQMQLGAVHSSRRRLAPIENLLNEDIMRVKLRHPKPLRVRGNRLFQIERPNIPAYAVVVGRRYVRAYPFGNRAAESIVRRNLGKFVECVRQVMLDGLAKSNFQPDRNTLLDIEKKCLDFDGIGADGFVSKAGARLARNKAFAYAIRQFFKDARFASQVWRDALGDFKKAHAH